MKKKIILAVAFLLMIVTLTSCNDAQMAPWQKETYKQIITVDDDYLVTSGTLTVAISPDYAPYEFEDITKTGDAMFAGADVYFANYLAQSMGLKLAFKKTNFDNVFAEVTTNHADIVISGLTYTADRDTYYDLTKTYHQDGEGGQVLICKAVDLDKYKTLEDLNKPSVKVAAQSNSLQYELTKGQLPNCNLEEISKITDAVTMLKNNKIDALAISEFAALSIVNSDTSISIIKSAPFDSKNSGNIAALKLGNKLTPLINEAIDNLPPTAYKTWLDIATELAEKLNFEKSNIFSNIKNIINKYFIIILQGIGITLGLSIITVIFGTLIGALVTLINRNRHKPVRFLGKSYVEFIRGIPLLLLLWLIYLSCPKGTPVFVSVVVALLINSGAYVTEIIRAGINAVDVGQTEAARSLGLSKFQTMKQVVFPQAVKNILPALGNEFIAVIKETSLASVFFVGDLMTAKNQITSITYLSIEPFIIVGIIYFILTFSLSKLMNKLEGKLHN